MQFTTHDADQLDAKTAAKLPLLRAIARGSRSFADRGTAIIALITLGETLPGAAVDVLIDLASKDAPSHSNMAMIDAALRRGCIPDGLPRRRLLESLSGIASDPCCGWFARRVSVDLLAHLGIKLGG